MKALDVRYFMLSVDERSIALSYRLTRQALNSHLFSVSEEEDESFSLSFRLKTVNDL